MEQSSNNKALACFILYGAPLVLLAKHGWQLGILMCLLFLGSYSFLPYIKNIRSNVRTLDKHVFVSYIVVIALFAAVDMFSKPHYWKTITILILGFLSLVQLKKLQQYFLEMGWLCILSGVKSYCFTNFDEQITLVISDSQDLKLTLGLKHYFHINQ